MGLGYLKENGNYSKARIVVLLLGLMALAILIWLIVLTVKLDNYDQIDPKGMRLM